MGFLFLVLGPVLASLYLSFTKYSPLTAPIFIGLQNYVTAFTQDKLFATSMGNTFFYVGFSVPLAIVSSLLLALLLDQGLRATKLFRTLFFLPSITPTVASVLLWKWIFQPDFGIVNYVLSLAGIHGPAWLASTAMGETKPDRYRIVEQRRWQPDDHFPGRIAGRANRFV